MPFEKGSKQEKRETSKFEEYPQQKPDKSKLAPNIGKLAVKGAMKDKPKK